MNPETVVAIIMAFAMCAAALVLRPVTEMRNILRKRPEGEVRWWLG